MVTVSIESKAREAKNKIMSTDGSVITQSTKNILKEFLHVAGPVTGLKEHQEKANELLGRGKEAKMAKNKLNASWRKL